MAKVLNVLLLTDRLDASGVTSYTQSLAAALVRKNYGVKVVAGGGSLVDSFRADKVDIEVVHNITSRFLRPLVRLRLRHIIKRFGPDLLHLQHERLAPLARDLAEATGIPYLLTVHHFHRAGASIPYAAGQLKKIVAVSDPLRENLVNDVRIAKDFIAVVPNGVDVARFAPRARGSGNRVPVVGTVGALIERKGQKFFIEAAKKVLDRGVDAEFVVAGDGKDKQTLRGLVKELGIAKRMTFVRETVDTAALLNTFDIYASPSLSEGLGISVLEAMACATPVIATGVGGIYSIVEDGVSGLIVPAKDSDALAEKIIALAQDSGFASDLAANAREVVKQRFSLARMMDKMELLYKAALTEGAGAEEPAP